MAHGVGAEAPGSRSHVAPRSELGGEWHGERVDAATDLPRSHLHLPRLLVPTVPRGYAASDALRPPSGRGVPSHPRRSHGRQNLAQERRLHAPTRRLGASWAGVARRAHGSSDRLHPILSPPTARAHGLRGHGCPDAPRSSPGRGVIHHSSVARTASSIRRTMATAVLPPAGRGAAAGEAHAAVAHHSLGAAFLHVLIGQRDWVHWGTAVSS